MEGKATVSEKESGLKTKETVEEKVDQAVEVMKPSEPSGVEKALKEKATLVKGKEIEVAKKEAHEAEELEEKEVTVKASLQTEGTEEAVKPQVGGKFDKGVSDALVSPSEEKAPVLEKVSLEVNEETRIEYKKPPLGIPIPETLLLKDIKIEVFLRRFSSEIPAPAASEQPQLPKATEITNISCEKSADIVEVRIRGNGSMTPYVFPADNNRIVIDIPDVVLNAPLPSAIVSPLKRIRSGKHKDKIRLVLDLREKLDFDVLSTGDSIAITVHKVGKKPSLPPMAQKPAEKNEAVELKEMEMPNVLLQLLKKAHPMANRKNGSEKQQEVAVVEGREETHVEGTIGVMRLFSVAKVEKGIYTFIIKNKGKEPYEADVVFRLFEGKAGERLKEFRTIGLSPNAVLQFKFVLPEAVFWDDEDYFTGTLEDSYTLTKFNDKTGLIWKEEKDY